MSFRTSTIGMGSTAMVVSVARCKIRTLAALWHTHDHNVQEKNPCDTVCGTVSHIADRLASIATVVRCCDTIAVPPGVPRVHLGEPSP